MLTPEQNAKAYDSGYFYPGPAVEGATLDKAPQEWQDVIEEFGRPGSTTLIAAGRRRRPLDADDHGQPRSTSGTARSAAASSRK